MQENQNEKVDNKKLPENFLKALKTVVEFIDNANDNKSK